MSKTEVLVEGIKMYGFHGCIDEEAKAGTDFIVDVRMQVDFMEAAQKDDLRLTADYVIVYKIVKTQMEIRSKLIEHVAKRIYDKIKAHYPNISEMEVKVTKLNPPVNGYVEKVAVIVK